MFGVFLHCLLCCTVDGATHGLPAVRAPVYRGCPCRDPVGCPPIPRQDGIEDKAPTLWLLQLLLTEVGAVLVTREHACDHHYTCCQRHPPSVERTCRGFQPTWVAPCRTVHLRSVLVSSQVSAQLSPHLENSLTPRQQGRFQGVRIQSGTSLWMSKSVNSFTFKLWERFFSHLRRFQISRPTQSAGIKPPSVNFLCFLLILCVTPTNHFVTHEGLLRRLLLMF